MQLIIIDIATTQATILFFLAGGMMIAINIPYSPTLSALTMLAGGAELVARAFVSKKYTKVGSKNPGWGCNKHHTIHIGWIKLFRNRYT